MMSSDFEIELQRLLNKHNIDQFVDMPDFILASFLIKTLDTLRISIKLNKQLAGSEYVE